MIEKLRKDETIRAIDIHGMIKTNSLMLTESGFPVSFTMNWDYLYSIIPRDRLESIILRVYVENDPFHYVITWFIHHNRKSLQTISVVFENYSSTFFLQKFSCAFPRLYII